jgi:hypothetical protein
MRRLTGLPLRLKILIGGAVLLLLILLIAVIFLVRSTTSAEDQPIAFNHEVHAQNGIQCQFCHIGVDKGPAATIPSVELCMGCHQYVATDSPEIKKLAGYWERQEPIPWVRVNKEPSYVYFNHHSHIAAGVSCGNCHGNVASMTVAEPVSDLSMSFCLDCHAKQENKEQLWDCAVCHR